MRQLIPRLEFKSMLRMSERQLSCWKYAKAGVKCQNAATNYPDMAKVQRLRAVACFTIAVRLGFIDC